MPLSFHYYEMINFYCCSELFFGLLIFFSAGNLLYDVYLRRCNACKHGYIHKKVLDILQKSYSLRHFHLVQNLADDFVRSHVAGFCLVSQTVTVAKYVMGNSAHIFGNDIAATLDERITACS